MDRLNEICHLNHGGCYEFLAEDPVLAWQANQRSPQTSERWEQLTRKLGLAIPNYIVLVDRLKER